MAFRSSFGRHRLISWAGICTSSVGKGSDDLPCCIGITKWQLFSTSKLPPVFQVQEVAKAVLRKSQTSLAFLHFFLELGQQSWRSLSHERTHGRHKKRDFANQGLLTWRFVFHDCAPLMPHWAGGSATTRCIISLLPSACSLLGDVGHVSCFEPSGFARPRD